LYGSLESVTMRAGPSWAVLAGGEGVGIDLEIGGVGIGVLVGVGVLSSVCRST